MGLFNIFSNWQKAKDYERIKKENCILIEKLQSCEKECKRLDDKNVYLDRRRSDIIKLKEIVKTSFEKDIQTSNDWEIKTFEGRVIFERILLLRNQNKLIPKRDKTTGRFIKK